MNILGLSGSTHDPSAAVIIDGKVITAIEEERLVRVKHASHFLPIESARAVIKQAGLKPNDIDIVTYFFDPSLFDRQVVNYILREDPMRYIIHPIVYRTHKFLMRGRRYKNELIKLLDQIGMNDTPIEFVRHHLAHAASAYYLSPFNKAMILTLDNMGELESTVLAKGEEDKIEVISTQAIPHSLGMFYSVITDYLGFRAWDEEGKVMALAAYGKPTIPLEDIVELGGGKFEIKRDFQMIQTLAKDRLFGRGLVKRFGEPRKRGEPITQRHKDIAASAQFVVEEIVKYLVTWLHSKTGYRNLCLAGGVALNCKMNYELLNLPFVEDIYVSPASSDAGTSLGCAMYTYVKNVGKKPQPLLRAGIGRRFTNDQILAALKVQNVNYKKIKDPSKTASDLLLRGKVIAWFQGGSEFGPRALGHRSILSLPYEESMRDYVNNIKQREMWRPLCPSILAQSAKVYVKNPMDGRFMNVAFRSTEFAKHRIPAVVHVDETVRVQRVYDTESIIYSNLLKNIETETGDPVLLNTSFNVAGEPMVDSPMDAIISFKKMPIDALVIGNYILTKEK